MTHITATEIQLSMAEYTRRLDQIRNLILQPMINCMTKLMMGPRRKRWDQYGAYHRRQLKKWSKRQAIKFV